MAYLADEDQEGYRKQFGRFIAEGLDSDAIEDMYKDCHAAIRADPSCVAAARLAGFPLGQPPTHSTLQARRQEGAQGPPLCHQGPQDRPLAPAAQGQGRAEEGLVPARPGRQGRVNVPPGDGDDDDDPTPPVSPLWTKNTKRKRANPPSSWLNYDR